MKFINNSKRIAQVKIDTARQNTVVTSDAIPKVTNPDL